MIRVLTENDYVSVQAHLNQDPLHNIYLIHGLQTYGLASDLVTFWGAFDDDRLAGVLFADNEDTPRCGFLAGDDPEVLARLGKFARKSGIGKLIGISEYIQPVVDSLPSRVPTVVLHLDFYETHPGQLVPSYRYPVRSATEEDVPLLVELYKHCELYTRNHQTEQEIEHKIRKVMGESGVYFLAEWEGRALSAAQVAPEIDEAGVIDSATTLPEFRGRGMYYCVRTACLEYLFGRGKIGLSVIRGSNASVKRVVAKTGGSCTAQWLIVKFTKKPPLRRRILPLWLRRWGLQMLGREVTE
jgi:hypothetical protein